MTRFVLLAVFGALLIAGGVGWWIPQLGLIIAGVEAVALAYVGLYFTAKGVLSAKAVKS